MYRITGIVTGLPIGYSVIVALTGLPIAYSVIVALTGLPIEYSVIVALTGLPIGYSVIVALTGLPIGYSVIVALTVSLIIQVQIHGPVCLSENVECIVVNDRFRGNELIEKQLEEFVTKNNCNLIWMEPDETSGGTSLTTLGHFGPLPTVSHSRRKRRKRH